MNMCEYLMLYTLLNKIKLLNMQKGNTLLYHNHIINGIDNLDQRKDGYIGHRL